MMDDYIEHEEFTCPACGHIGTRSRDCTEFNCDDGYIDLGELDWQDDGEYELCAECWGTGVVRWCPSCGADLQATKWREAMDAQFRAEQERDNQDDREQIQPGDYRYYRPAGLNGE